MAVYECVLGELWSVQLLDNGFARHPPISLYPTFSALREVVSKILHVQCVPAFAVDRESQQDALIETDEALYKCSHTLNNRVFGQIGIIHLLTLCVEIRGVSNLHG
jgi:hypothetical protein